MSKSLFSYQRAEKAANPEKNAQFPAFPVPVASGPQTPII
jgi:hypothetical protein